MKKFKRIRRIFAWIGIVVLVGLYVTTLILAFSGSPLAQALFLRFLRGYRGFPGAALRHADHLPDPETRRYRRRPGQEKKDEKPLRAFHLFLF